MKKTFQNLQEIMHEEDRENWRPGHPDRRQAGATMDKPAQEKIVPVQRLVLMQDENVTIRIPEAPITSPEQCVGIFRQIFKGARQEMAAVISLSKQLEFLNAAPVAWGTVDHVYVERRNLFTEVLCRSNAAYFVFGHNHLGTHVTPSPDDLKMLRDVWRDSWRMDCPMKDFIIVGNGTEAYYSHRDVSYQLELAPPKCSCDL